MLKKLIKYDLKWLFKIITVFYILGLSLSIIGRLMDLLPDSTFFLILTGIVKGSAIALLVNGIVNSTIRIWVRTVHNIYKDEGYLTNTLPVNIEKIFLSKVISSIIVTLVSFVVLAGGLAILYLNKELIEGIKVYLSLISDSTGVNIGLIIIILLLLLFAELLFIILTGLFGISVGYSFNHKKLLKTFIASFITYALFNALTSIIILISVLFSSELNEFIFGLSGTIQANFLVIFLICSIVVYCLYTIILYFGTRFVLRKGVNLD